MQIITFIRYRPVVPYSTVIDPSKVEATCFAKLQPLPQQAQPAKLNSWVCDLIHPPTTGAF